jgi:excisionase family DNA binding protein
MKEILSVSRVGGYRIARRHVQPECEHLLREVDPLLTVQEASAALDMSQAAFYRAVRHNIPTTMLDGKQVRFRLSDVVAYFENRLESANGK